MLITKVRLIRLKRTYITAGATQALQFVFSLFPEKSEILINTPCWGTTLNICQYSGCTPKTVQLFKEGKFQLDTAQKSITVNTRALYLNVPSNPTGIVYTKKEMLKCAHWAVENNIHIFSDEPYKYLIYNKKKTPYYSPVGFSEEISNITTVIGSFSKTIKPDIRAGFIRIAPDIINHKDSKNLKFYFRNLSAGIPRPIQQGIVAVLDTDPNLSYLEPIVRGYEEKIDIISKYLVQLNCEVESKPDAGYLAFLKTPHNENGEEFVMRYAKEHKIGFLPGSNFDDPTNRFKNYIRVGIGGGITIDKIHDIFSTMIKNQ